MIAVEEDPRPKGFARWMTAAVVAVVCGVIAGTSIGDPVLQRVTIIAVLCLTLWLTEVVPPYIPTLLLWALTPLLLSRYGSQFGSVSVLGWAANPVLVLFLGGFALSVAARRYGIDNVIARWAVRISRGSRIWLLVLTMIATAALSMWMSNIAAAATMIVALHPLTAAAPANDRFRRALLVGIALAANFGGIATPIGTGPNAIAIAAISQRQTVTFAHWMTFALPLSLGLLAAGFLLLAWRFQVTGSATDLPTIEVSEITRGGKIVVVLFFATVAAWLTEPLHGISAATVALLTTALLFGSRLLKSNDLGRIDWSTLLLIAGGITLGNLLEQGGVARLVGSALNSNDISATSRLFILCFTSAMLSALMSNTAAVTMLIPLAAAFDPAPSTAILIAIAASLGIPFVISTPPNAMVHGEGGVTFSDLFVPGIVLMLLGCVIITLTGPFVLGFLGIR